MKKIILLDYLRAFAAIYVVIHHFFESTLIGSDFFLLEILKQGQAAVILFFLLSGFVIHYNYKNKASSVSYKNYLIKRVRRIYPIYLFALILPYVFWVISDQSTEVNPTFINFFGGVFMLQDLGRYPGVIIKTFYNSPLWSISYEWFFYLFYLPLLKFKPNYSILLKGLLISLLGLVTFYLINNKISMTTLYFIIWIIGADVAECFLKYSKYPFKIFFKHILILTFFVLVFICQLNFDKKIIFGIYPFIQSYHFFVTLFFIICLYFLQKLNYLSNIRETKSVTFFSNISYSLYAIHYPICISFSQIFFKQEIVGLKPFVFGLMITIVISYLLEGPLQKLINKKTNKYLSD